MTKLKSFLLLSKRVILNWFSPSWTKTTCEYGICYHKSYKSRHLKSKVHLEGLEKMKTKEVEVKKLKEDEQLENYKYKNGNSICKSCFNFWFWL